MPKNGTQKSHLDDTINYKQTIIDSISKSQEVLALISNDPNIDISSDKALDIIENNIFDYPYIDDTTQIATAFIMIESDIVEVVGAMKTIELYVQVVVDKLFMDLKGCSFIGLKGNRLENITRFVDLLINNSPEFGIGKISLASDITAPVPSRYASKILTYSTSNFVRNGKLGNV